MPALPGMIFTSWPAIRFALSWSSVALHPMKMIRLASTALDASPRKLNAFSCAFSRTAQVLMTTREAVSSALDAHIPHAPASLRRMRCRAR